MEVEVGKGRMIHPPLPVLYAGDVTALGNIMAPTSLLALRLQQSHLDRTMVIGLLAIAAIPTVTGVGQAIGAQNRQNAASKEQEKVNLMGMMPYNGAYRDAGPCVLLAGKVSLPDCRCEL